MADNSYFLPEDAPTPPAQSAPDPLATPEQWASMTFDPILIDDRKFGPGWDQTRGAIARTAVALLRFDDQALTRHFLAEAEPLRRALDVHAGLQQEIEYLRTHLEALETAATRVLCVASRCAEDQP
ncbi:MAG: hypothetical protein ABW171_17820 [Steroidobacter sp.]